MYRSPIFIRQATEADVDVVTQLFRETVLNINAQDYSGEQTNIWSAMWQNRNQWLKKIREQHFLLAESKGNLAGFGSVASNGYLDMLYVGKDYQRKGAAKALLMAMEDFARKQGIYKIYADVSITARPFFERNGFSVEKEQRKMMNGVEFINFRMHKPLFML